ASERDWWSCWAWPPATTRQTHGIWWTRRRIFASLPTMKTVQPVTLDVAAELLVVSQFTLYADTRRGRRPDFTRAAEPDDARRLYGRAVEMFRETGLTVATGEFQAYMQVRLQNDGPVTLMLDSEDRNRPRRG
ncbi:D-aminoacyl-tRNA deacylase, partial [Geodia barretti]